MFKVLGFAATVHQESRFMCGFHVSHDDVMHVLCFSLQTFLKNTLSPLFTHTYAPLLRPYPFYSATLFPLHHRQQPIYSYPLPVHLSLRHGQVCPCVASSNRKCIMDVTFLSISTTKSHTPLCSQAIMKVRGTCKKMLA